MAGKPGYRILIVDDEPSIRNYIGRACHSAGYTQTMHAATVEAARQTLADEGPFDLVVLDIFMPGESGLVLLEELAPRAPEIVTIMVTAGDELTMAVNSLKMGAYDYLIKPIEVESLQLSVGRALKRRERELAEASRRESANKAVARRLSALQKTRSGLIRAMCLMAEFRDTEKRLHLDRVAMYSHTIALQLASDSAYAPFVTDEFLWDLFEVAPLHDVGKVALPDGILLKPGKLSAAELSVMQTHTTIGRDICLAARDVGGADTDSLITMAADIAGGHHERWDGKGYPGGVRGAHIPLSARIVSLADFYDVCRTPTVYRPTAMPRGEALALAGELSGTKFDPIIMQAFHRCRDSIMEIEEEAAA